ncbi:type II secretion system protein [Caminibacter pacificus]|uniref:Type II secretion system protein n=1 Tax=Caminibacter pacificus TaxID=1424653 RepID=A0AAJ4UWZ9_9BACT|nr:type II secretion system protein [Caminibacter pacificus]QDD68156.1 type II secretion system protein [Caminibacter pacificus]ROR38774.1 hypothetical protein EDC58_1989 [Caminibacter pacificus]
MRKAFSMIEIIIALIVASFVAYIGLQKFLDSQKEKYDNEFLSKMNVFVSSALLDATTGYPNGTGGYCSNDNSYTGLTAQRAVKCIGWEKAYSVGGTDPKSYIYKLDVLNSISADGCYIYLREPLSTDTNNIFYMYVDCSNYKGNKQMIEDLISTDIKRNFYQYLQNVDRKASSVDYSADATNAFVDSGTDSDGKVGFQFKN